MEVKKSVFFNILIKEYIYVQQSFRFSSATFLNHIFKLNKTFYGLKQTWYGHLSSFITKTNDFTRGEVDITLFRKDYFFDFIII